MGVGCKVWQLNSGDTHDLAVLDFDGDNDADLVTIDADGLIRFYENRQVNGYVEIGRPVQAVTTGKLSYGLSVHLGTTRMLVNNQARVIWPTRNGAINQILPFGKSLAEDTPEFESYKLTFTSKELDHDLDLHYFGARYYHAFLPRFISPDPEGGDPKVPLSWNRYLYCRDDPVNLVDPDGEWATPISGLNVPTFEVKWSDQWFDLFGIGGQCYFVEGAMSGVSISARSLNSGARVSYTTKGNIGKVAENHLPIEFKRARDEIKAGTNRPNVRNPKKFENRKKVLPQADSEGNPIEYTEFTVNPRQPGGHLDGNRIIIGSDGSEYITSDHMISYQRIISSSTKDEDGTQ